VTHCRPSALPSLSPPQPRAGSAGHSPDTRRSTSDWLSEVLRRVSGESPGRLPTCLRRWAERAAAGERPRACLGRRPGVGGVNQDSGKWQRRGPKHRQATDWCPAQPGEIRRSFGVQALPAAGTVATCIGPPQPNASAVNGLSTADNLPCARKNTEPPLHHPQHLLIHKPSIQLPRGFTAVSPAICCSPC